MSETEVSAAEQSLGSTKLSQNCVRLSNVQQNWVQAKQCQVKTEWGWTIPVKSKLKQKCLIWKVWVSNVKKRKRASPNTECMQWSIKTMAIQRSTNTNGSARVQLCTRLRYIRLNSYCSNMFYIQATYVNPIWFIRNC